MKLRVRGNSVRLRLLRGEVRRLAEEGAVRETVAFSPGEVLVYSLELREDASRMEARFASGSLRVILPRAIALEWALSDEISLEGAQETGGDALKLLIEKDFTCLNPRAVWQEDQSDNFPNPSPSCGGTHV